MAKRIVRSAAAAGFAATAFIFCILLRGLFIWVPALRLGHPLSAVLRGAFRARMIGHSLNWLARRSLRSCCALLALLCGSIRRLFHTSTLISIELVFQRGCPITLT